ncbi:MAG: hypothetical protein V7739_09850 [Motiliproteus sp.]
MTDSPLRIGLVGFHAPALSLLELFLDRQPHRYLLVHPDTAEALIYNADQPIALEKQRDQYLNEYGKPGIAVSINDISWKGMIALRKPYSQDSLLLALQQLSEHLALGKELDCGADKQSQNRNDEVIAVFRQHISRGKGEHNGELEKIRQQADRRKGFQEQFLARKRSAEQVLERLKAGTVADIYSPQEIIIQPDLRTTSADIDILAMTEQVITAQTAITNPIAEQSPAPRIKLTSATEQEILDCCGNSPDLNLGVHGQRRRLMFNPEGQLLSLARQAIERAHQEQSSVAIDGLSKLHLVYQPECGRFYSGINEDFLAQMAHVRFQFGELKLRLLSEERIETIRQQTDFAYYPANQLLWKLACWSSRGRLMGGIDLDACYQLEQLPDSNVLIGLPHTEKLIELWQAGPRTAQQVMDRLRAEQRFVFPFMTAAWVLGWLKKQ